mgnify:CR=1 FL=1
MIDTLILLTSSYPNDSGETFVESEMHYLEKSFNRIIIICSSQKKGIKRYIPNNAEVIFFNGHISKISMLSSIGLIFKNIFWQEKKLIKSHLGLPFTFFKFKVLAIDFLMAKKLEKLISKRIKKYCPADMLLYSYWDDYKALAIALLNGKTPALKTITRAHGWDLYFERNPEDYLPWKTYIHSHLSAVYFISETGMHYSENKISTWKGGNYKLARLGTENENELKKQILSDSLIIYSCSNIITLKRLDLIVEALNKMKNIPFEWFHIGDGPEKENIFDKIQNLKINNKCFLLGLKTNAEVLELYKKNQIDVFINASFSEGLPVSIMEAMSFGIPVIATSVGGTPEIVKNGYNGFLLRANPSPVEIAEALTKFYNLTVDEKNKMRQNAYTTWDQEYNAKKNYKSFIDAISKCQK